MNKIEAVILDSREPAWVQRMNFGVPTTVMMMDSGDAQVMCSDGVMLLTNGTAAAMPPTAPAQPDAMIQVRLLLSTGVSLMGILKNAVCIRVNPQL